MPRQHFEERLASILEINFETEELRDLCSEEDFAVQKLGPDVAEVLRRRISDIRAADSILEVPVGAAPGTCVFGECYDIKLGKSASMAVVPNHATPKFSPDGKADWPRIRRVRVVALEA